MTEKQDIVSYGEQLKRRAPCLPGAEGHPDVALQEGVGGIAGPGNKRNLSHVMAVLNR